MKKLALSHATTPYLLVFAILVASVKHLLNNILESWIHGLCVLGIFLFLNSQGNVLVDAFG